jgi:hypothetical protein
LDEAVLVPAQEETEELPKFNLSKEVAKKKLSNEAIYLDSPEEW